MPRTARAAVGGVCYHFLNRGNDRRAVFHKGGDFAAFVKALAQAAAAVPPRPLADCLMPYHFHLVSWPRGGDDLGVGMRWLLTTHLRRYHRRCPSNGHLWQGRFQAFPVPGDARRLTVPRSGERNPLRAGRVAWAEEWSRSSLPGRARPAVPAWLSAGPVALPADRPTCVNAAAMLVAEAALRACARRDGPYATEGVSTIDGRGAGAGGRPAATRPAAPGNAEWLNVPFSSSLTAAKAITDLVMKHSNNEFPRKLRILVN